MMDEMVILNQEVLLLPRVTCVDLSILRLSCM
jgi:hypothetical protein